MSERLLTALADILRLVILLIFSMFLVMKFYLSTCYREEDYYFVSSGSAVAVAATDAVNGIEA
jgi:hypothetical protein